MDEFQEFDRVKLVKAITAKGRALRVGLAGSVVYCHGGDAYEVEFSGISDFFQIPRDHLQKS
jgi:hypothetical protein